jgi:hypothetical protein
MYLPNILQLFFLRNTNPLSINNLHFPQPKARNQKTLHTVSKPHQITPKPPEITQKNRNPKDHHTKPKKISRKISGISGRTQRSKSNP